MKNETRHPRKVYLHGKTVYLSKFRTLDTAIGAQGRSEKPAWIVLGDNDDRFGGFWLCRPVDAAKLERDGYEIVKYN